MKTMPRGETLIKVGYRIPVGLKEALEKKAREERRSVNDQVICLLERALQEKGQKEAK